MPTNNLLLEKLQSCPETSNDIHKYFSETADLLMNNYVILKRGIEYEIVEIEFYLFTPDHPDVITYPRNCIAGQWFFHQSGVDLTFATTDKQFGGILIRGLREVKGERKQVFGPLNCVDLLWDKFDAFEAVAAEIPTIVPSTECTTSPAVAFPRWIPVGKDKVKASAKIAEWIKKGEKEVYSKFENDDIEKLVFESKYRFVKEQAIDFDDKVCKQYNANIKRLNQR